MNPKVFINLPVKDVKKTISFFEHLGYSFNPQFTDENAACMIISETVFAMFLAENHFKTFTRKEIVDAKKATEVLMALEVDSVGKVKQLIEKARQAGGEAYGEPQDYGWMYQHCFADPDGHLWEIMFVDNSKIPQA